MFQKLIFKPRSKSNKNCIKDVAKNKKKKTISEKESEDLKIADDREKAGKEEEKLVSMNASQVDALGDSNKERKIRFEKDKKVDSGMVVSVEEVIRKDGQGKSEEKTAENCPEERENKTPDGEGSEENGEPLGKEEDEEVTETVVTVETQSETKQKEIEGTSKVECAVENGIETDEEKDDGEEKKIKTEEQLEVIAKETVADPTTTNPSPVEAQE